MDKNKSTQPTHWHYVIASLIVAPSFLVGVSSLNAIFTPGESNIQWLTVGGFVAAALLLLKRTEQAWSASLFLLMGIIFSSAVQVLRAPSSLMVMGLLIAEVLMAVGASLYIKTFFRYPFVDRRGLLQKKAQRHSSHLAVHLSAHMTVNGHIDNISLTGARIRTEEALPSSMRQIMFANLEIPGLDGIKIKCRVMGTEPSFIRVKFIELPPWEKQVIARHIGEKTTKEPISA